MKRIKLFDRSEEIFDKLPKQYAEIILNNIIAKSVSNGQLFEEVQLYLTSEQFNELKGFFKRKKEVPIKSSSIMERGEDSYVEKHKTKKEVKVEEAKEVFTY